jgi:Flp pilus assembly pilin Flp
MDILRKLLAEEQGQGLTEYALIVFLVALVFWLGVKDTNVGDSLANIWSSIIDCLGAPFSCSSES